MRAARRIRPADEARDETADQHVLGRGHDAAGDGQALGHQPERDLPQGREVAGAEEIAEGRVDPIARIDVPVAHALAQRLRRDVDKLDLVCAVEGAVGHRLADDDSRDALDHVLDALHVLNVDRGHDVDTRVSKIVDVLPALLMSGSRRIGVGQLVHQGDLGMPDQHGLQVHLLEHRPAVLNLFPRHHLEPVDRLNRPWPAIRLDQADHHVLAPEAAFTPLPKHGVGFP